MERTLSDGTKEQIAAPQPPAPIEGLKGPLPLLDELWREYEFGFGDAVRTYRIEGPAWLYFRDGGSTHRVIDLKGVVHCPPAPGKNGCVLRWFTRDPKEHPVQF